MTDLIQRPSQLPDRVARSERNAAMVIYGLYLASPLSLGVTGLVGAVMASGRRARAGAVSASHFRFQTWTFGTTTGAGLTGALWMLLGSLSSVADRTGGDLALAGGGLAVTAGVAFIGASIFGLSRAAEGEPIGHPH